MHKIILFSVLVTVNLLVSAQQSEGFRDSAYKELRYGIKEAIVKNCHISRLELDSFYRSKKIQLSWVNGNPNIKRRQYLEIYLIRFVDTIGRVYVFSIYTGYIIDKTKHGVNFYSREPSVPYFISGFDTIYMYERKRIIGYLDNVFRGTILSHFLDIPYLEFSENYTMYRNLCKEMLSDDTYTKKKIRKYIKPAEHPMILY